MRKGYPHLEGRVPSIRMVVEKRGSPSPWMVGFIFLFFMGMLLILFLRSPLSLIEQIHIKGNHLVTERDILTKAGLKKGASYFLVSRSQVEHRLKSLPEIAEVQVTKSFPHQIYIQMKEKPLIALLKTKEKRLVPLLADGTILQHRILSSFHQAVPVFEGWTDASSTLMAETAKQLAHLPESIRREIMMVEPVSMREDQVELQSKRGHSIRVRVANLQKMMSYYPFFLHHPPGNLYLLESVWFTPAVPN
jgi:cell division protein FtsQ